MTMSEENPKTATEAMIYANEERRRSLYPDLRLQRATSLVAAVLQKIDPYLDRQQDRARRDAYEALIELFHSEGVDVITDHDRAAVGLPPRGPSGLTSEEMLAMEKRRLDYLLAPITVRLPIA